MSSSTAKICFNSECKDINSDRWRKGWRLRNYDFANLCDLCGSIYEEGRFCDTFHKYASGWRCCETCGKRVHCGCIVSIHSFVVLDAGGIECAVCARKDAILTPNQMWPLRPLPPERLTECSIRNCNQTCRSGPPGVVQRTMDMYNKNNKSAACSNLESRSYFEAGMSTGIERLIWSDRSAAFSSERNQNQNLSFSNGSLKHYGSELLEYGKAAFSREEEAHSCLVNPGYQSFLKDRQSAVRLSSGFPLASVVDNQPKVSGVHSQQLSPEDVLGKKLSANSCNGSDFSHQTQIRKCKPVDVHVQKELLPRYWSKVFGHELQQISGGSNSVITPLFEKMLSVSDAGRVGRLVLPKKCAESYFPPISQSEGLPLKVQDIKGKEWTFQFRFWPNNNSRMYVLEGITNCIQSLELQAGDVVTFSRIEPEGKLIMGFRKASKGSQPEQSTGAVKNGHEVDTVGDVGDQKPKLDEKLTYNHLKVKEAIGGNSSVPCKRKNGMLSSKRKHSEVTNVNFLEFKVTLEEVQGLFRSPADHAPHVEVIEDFEFEEYEDAPVIGRPTVFAKDSVGEDVQWAQCDDCLKWRKLPSDFIVPARWTCSKNFLDPDRSLCNAAQELTIEQLKAASRKLLDAQLDAHTSEVLEALASFAIEGDNKACPDSAIEGDSVCIQPPSGKSPKHKQNCVNTMEKVILCNPMKGQIDLNIKPDRDEEASTCCESQSSDPGCKIKGNGNQSESQSSRLVDDKLNLGVSHKNSNNNSIVEQSPLVHPFASTSIRR